MNISITENGAVGFKTTGKALLDLNFAMGGLRGKSEKAKSMFEKAYEENPILAVKWLFYARDARQGMGERDTTRSMMSWLQWKHPEVLRKVIHLLPEYGRWDDVVYLMEFSNIRDDAVNLIAKQLKEDLINLSKGDSVSLLGKWLPSLQASSAKTRMRANDLAKRMGLSAVQYRKMCSKLRKYTNVLECKLAANEWHSVDYTTVPSQANIKYSKAFYRHDKDRYSQFLEAANNGEVKINASVIMPYEIVHKYTNGHHSVVTGVQNELEALWKNLPDIPCNGMVMLDGSGSMSCRIGRTNVSAHDVADSLAVYFAQHTHGKLHGKFMTFGMNPDFVDISDCETLKECLDEVSNHTDCSNTDIYKAYIKLCDMAVKFGLSQEDLPDRLVIISDMEFDQGCCGRFGDSSSYTHGVWGNVWNRYTKADRPLFDSINEYWNKAGYKMPKLVFWNVNSRTGTIPLKENDLGVTLVSGFSVQIAKMVMSEQLDPFYALYETLSSERYKAVEDCLMKV